LRVKRGNSIGRQQTCAVAHRLTTLGTAAAVAGLALRQPHVWLYTSLVPSLERERRNAMRKWGTTSSGNPRPARRELLRRMRPRSFRTAVSLLNLQGGVKALAKKISVGCGQSHCGRLVAAPDVGHKGVGLVSGRAHPMPAGPASALIPAGAETDSGPRVENPVTPPTT
jgi:hypothetical protein